jgi:hypothetical protein
MTPVDADAVELPAHSCASAWPKLLLLAGLLSVPLAVHAQDNVVISEFIARNAGGLADEDGDFPDWIELHNSGVTPVNLDGWFLTDTTNNLAKWRLPAANIAANGYLIVFASGKNRTNAGAPLHANFQLNGDGEYLGLVRPDLTIATEFAPTFPEQFDNISYGDGQSVTLTKLLSAGASAKFLIPTDGALGTNWAYLTFNDADWSNAITGLGFSSSTATNLRLHSYWPIREGAGNVISNLVAGRANGTVNGATWVNNDPQRGTVLNFNGASAYVAAGTIPRMGLATSNFTWSFWFKQNAVNNVNAVVLGNRSGGVQSPLQFIKFTPTNFEYYRGGNIGFIPYSIPTGQWLHLAVVKNGNSLTYFANGVRVGASTASGDIESNPFFMGGDPGAPGEWANGLIDDVALWASALTTNQIQALAAGASPTALAGFGALTGTDVRSNLFGVSATVYVRVPFVVADGAVFNTLKLKVQFNDGFVAYLNGVEVARRNAPANAQWNSTATAVHPESESLAFEEIDLTAYLDVLENGANVLAIHALNLTVDDSDFLIRPELEAATVTGVGARYFGIPTPGAVNNLGFIGYVADTKFSHDRGFYDTNFALTITCATPGATIRYTTNGTAPSETNGLVYSAPIPITRTTVLRAGAFKAGYQPSDLDAQTYIFLSDVFAQTGAGLPSNWGNDWRMDPRVVTNAAYRADITNDMKSLPVVSLALDPQQFWGPQGIYTLATSQGVNFERACSAEMFFPDGSREGFQIECGLRIAGGASRSGLTPKHGLRLLFKSIYGASKLRYRFLDDTEVDRFDSLAFRPNFNMSWVRTDNSGPLLNGNSDGAERTHALYVRDQWTKESGNALGMPNAHERFVHLYINGVYWGIYNPGERTDASFAATYFGGEKEDYDAIFSDLSSTARAVDGDRVAWNAALAFANGGLSNATRYADFARTWVDVTNLADYMMLNFYCATVDWPWQNWNALRKRGTNNTFKTVVWDAEYTLDTLPWMPDDRTPNVGAGTGGVNGNDLDSPARFYYQCRFNPEFRLLFADRAHRHFFNNGALTTNQTIPRFLRLCDTIDRAIVCESARWGDVVRTSNPYTRNVEWLAEKARLLSVFFPRRTTNVIQHFRNAGLYPLVSAPEFNLHGASFSNQFTVIITAPVGTIYYTTNGDDPRLSGGALAPSAIPYTGPFTLTSSRNLKARALHTNTWSAITDANFIEITPLPLRITEIMFNPGPFVVPALAGNAGPAEAGTTNDPEDFEYIEVKNIGPAPLQVGGMQFTAGVTFTFSNLVLASGGHALVVKNRAAFEAHYGTGRNIAGEWIGFLSDDGERLRLEGALGEEIHDFDYDDWYPLTDGLGFALVTANEIGPLDRWGERESWRPGYSPDADDPAPSFPRVVVNEALTRTMPPAIDAIELHNAETTNVNIGGWFLTDDPGTPKKFRIPDGTMIPAGGYLVFTETNFNAVPGAPASFALSGNGDSVYLYSADANTNLTGYSHGFAFGAAEVGVSFGRYVTSTGEDQFPAQISNTLGAVNSGPRVGPVVISEVLYNALPGGEEFIELKNITVAPVLLYDAAHPANTWKVNGLGFDFPTGVSIPAAGYVLLASSDPAAFRARYAVATEVQIIQYAGSLQDDGETLELQRPDAPEGSDVPHIAVDTVRYNDRAPWPKAADGGGASLQRRDASQYGNDPINWLAAVPTPGHSASAGAPPEFTQQPSNQTVIAGETAVFSALAMGATAYQWFFKEKPITNATNAMLMLTNVQPGDAGPYQVAAYNAADSVVSAVAYLSVLVPATITFQPQSRTVFPLTNVTFEVAAASGSFIKYQWQFNEMNLEGATNNFFAITNVQPAHEGDYSVLIKDSIGTIRSAVARLTVLTHPVFSLQPTNRTVTNTPPVNVTLSSAATSSTPVRYQWLFHGTNLPGATNASLTISNVQPSHAGLYAVVATDSYGSITSATAILTVLVRPVITLQPISQAAVERGSATFTVAAEGTVPMGFRWRRGGVTFTGGIIISTPTNSSLTLTNLRLADSTNFNVAITNVAGSAPVSSNAVLTVLADSDADGIPDTLEPLDGAADSDGDGMNNAAEYFAGTDPLDPNSVLRLEIANPGSVTLWFNAVSNRAYTVQYSQRLGPASWQKFADLLARTNSRVETLVDPNPGAQRYYRLVTPVQP